MKLKDILQEENFAYIPFLLKNVSIIFEIIDKKLYPTIEEAIDEFHNQNHTEQIYGDDLINIYVRIKISTKSQLVKLKRDNGTRKFIQIALDEYNKKIFNEKIQADTVISKNSSWQKALDKDNNWLIFQFDTDKTRDDPYYNEDNCDCEQVSTITDDSGLILTIGA